MSKPLIWHGHLTTRSRLTRRGLSFALGPVLWLGVLLLIPLGLLVALAFAKRGTYGVIEWSFSLENLKRLLGFGVLGYSNSNLFILARSLWIALITTLLSILLAYPLAFFIAARSPRTRYLFLALVMIPFCTNMVIRAYAWMLLLSKDLPLARLATALHLIPADSPLYPSAFAIYLGMISCFLPFAVLPLYTNIERMDWSLIEAAHDLYASRWRIFRHAILPQTFPGLWAAVVLTFIPAMGTFVIPDLLGGANNWLVGNLIQQQFGKSRDYPFGAAASFALMLLTLAALFLFRRSASQEGARHES